MAKSVTSMVYTQLINEIRSYNDERLCTEQIPVETSKGTISRAMIDAIDRFAQTCDTRFIIELIQKAKATNYVYTKPFSLSASDLETANGNFKASFDVRRGQLLKIQIFINGNSLKHNIKITLIATNNSFKVVHSGNGSKISDRFLEAAKKIFTACL